MRARATSSASVSSASYNANKDVTPPRPSIKHESNTEQKPTEMNGKQAKPSDVDEEYPYQAPLPEHHTVQQLVGFPNVKNVLAGLV